MYGSVIAAFTVYFNIALVTVMAFFAVYGLIVLFGGKSRLNVFRGMVFLQAFCGAALVAFAFEATVFNFRSYLKRYAGSEFHTTVPSPDRPGVILTSDSAVTGFLSVRKDDDGMMKMGVRFNDLDRAVTSLFVDFDFGAGEQAELTVRWLDQESTQEFSKTLYRHLPNENHTAIHSHGKVSSLTVIVSTAGSDGSGGIIQLAVNKRIPLYFSGLRLFIVSLLVFAIIIFFHGVLRARVSYYLFEYRFDPADRKQNLVYAGAVALLILFAFVCTHTSASWFYTTHPAGTQFNRYLVDALIDGRWHLDFGDFVDPNLPYTWERPYDNHWRGVNGFSEMRDYIRDGIWYQGKYYAYFSPVPALLVFTPYKLVTGNYLEYHSGIFFFAAIVIVLMALFWRLLVRMYMPNSLFSFYLLAFLTLFFASSLFYPIRHASFYSVGRLSGFMFVIAGFLLLFKSVEKGGIKPIKLFFACFCLALAVGCRPNLMLVSFLVPVVLWKDRSWKLAALILTPYLMVAIPIWVHNYVNFGHILETGGAHYLTWPNNHAFGLMNPIGKGVRTFTSALYYLFFPGTYSLHFPFVYTVQAPSPFPYLYGINQSILHGIGMINFPIVLCLLYFFRNVLSKKRPGTFHILSAFLIIAAIQLRTISIMGFVATYMVDMAFYIILPSLFCAYYWSNRPQQGELPQKTRIKVVYALLAVSIFVGLFSFADPSAGSYSDPVLYRYLENSLGIVKGVGRPL